MRHAVMAGTTPSLPGCICFVLFHRHQPHHALHTFSTLTKSAARQSSVNTTKRRPAGLLMCFVQLSYCRWQTYADDFHESTCKVLQIWHEELGRPVQAVEAPL